MFINAIIHKNQEKWYSDIMKVLILITKSNMGGAQRYVYDLATHLPKESYDVEVMAGGNGQLIEKLKEAGIKSNGDLPLHRDINIIEDLKTFIKLFQLIRDKKPDVLHVNSSKIGGIGALIGRLLGIKNIIFTAHGWSFNEERGFISKTIIRFLHWLTIILSHKTIAVSNALKVQVENWPYIIDRIHVVHNGIENQAIFSKINARYELGKINSAFDRMVKTNQPKNLVIIGSVGELHHIKGYEYALEGLRSLINIMKSSNTERRMVYVIIGDGEYRERIENKIKDLSLENSVILLGNIPNAYQYMRAFDVYIMPSLSEGLPYALLEAGIAGLPTVASAVGGITEVIEDMRSGVLIQPKKAHEIQNALEFYISHKKIQSNHARALNHRVLTDFSINKMVEETMVIYRK